MIRDNKWLEQKLNQIWQEYFSDVKRLNTVYIHFGKKAKRRLASIRQKSATNKNSDTEIRVTAYYLDPTVPEYVVDATIAHEICHYAHGFASPHPQYFKHPHKGDIVDREMVERGLGEILDQQDKWLKESWLKIVGTDRPRRRAKRKPAKSRFNLFRLITNLSLD